MFKRIVVGTDGSATAASAVTSAADLAVASGASLHIVNAFKRLGEVVSPEMALAGVKIDDGQIAEWGQKLVDRAAFNAQSRGVSDVHTHAQSGSPVDVLISIAEDTEADLIVVGNRGMTGARRFLGSVPNSITHHAPCAVLIVRTDA